VNIITFYQTQQLTNQRGCLYQAPICDWIH